jgi:hypothetical protein
MPTPAGPIHGLILDATWTTGARVQSPAHALKLAGASTVAAIALGRHIDPTYPPAKVLLGAIADRIFDPSRCALED